MFCLTVNIFMTILSGLATLTPQNRNFFVMSTYFQQGHSNFFLILELPLDI